MVLLDHAKVRFRAVRSGGPGGQRTNRRSTKVQVWVSIKNLPLSDGEKRMLRRKFGKRLNGRGEIEVQSESSRSQELNRDEALRRLEAIIARALKVPRCRIPTTPPRGAEDRRIREKKFVSEKKRARRAAH
ncbi:MAG: peptide chain release factor-like protein [Candidatus Jorgensenbacteria bacterium]